MRFWTILRRFWGRSWAPKSLQNRQKWRPQSVSFFIRFRTSVMIDFRRIFSLKRHPKLTFFRLGSAKPNFVKSPISFKFLKDFRVSELRKSVEKRLRNGAGLSTRFGLRFGTVFGRFWGPKTEPKRSGTGLFGTSKNERFAEAMETAGT